MSSKILILFAIAMAIIAIEVSFMHIGWDEFVKSDRRLFSASSVDELTGTKGRWRQPPARPLSCPDVYFACIIRVRTRAPPATFAPSPVRVFATCKEEKTERQKNELFRFSNKQNKWQIWNTIKTGKDIWSACLQKRNKIFQSIRMEVSNEQNTDIERVTCNI